MKKAMKNMSEKEDTRERENRLETIRRAMSFRNRNLADSEAIVNRHSCAYKHYHDMISQGDNI